MFNKLCALFIFSTAAMTAIVVFYGNNIPNLSSIDNTKAHEYLKDQTPASIDLKYSIPSTVYYVWCQDDAAFKFRHYLSVKSVMKFIQPDHVVLYYKNKPHGSNYDMWIDDLIDTFPMFSLQKLPEDVCKQTIGKFNLPAFYTDGIYIGEDVILTSFNHQYRSYFNSLTVSDSLGKTLIQTRRHEQSAINLANNFGSSISVLRGGKSLVQSKVEKGLMVGSTLPGTSLDLWESIVGNTSKISLFIASYDFIPEHIWKLDSEAGQILRSVMYNTRNFVHAVPNYDQLAPNIAHVIWTNNDAMPFYFYLCALSLVDVAKVDKLYIHGESSPSGFYWNLIKDHPKISLVLRTHSGPYFEYVYGQRVDERAHVTDIWRLYIMQRYGGLYVDTDALFFRPLDHDIRGYDVVISKEVFPSSPFPEFYQNGVMLGKPGAKFWNVHLEAYKNYKRGDWSYNCCQKIYKIKERFPELIHEDPRLNVICFKERCYPTWLPSYRNENTDNHLVTGSLKNWKTDCYAIQHCFPDLPEFANHVKLLANNGSTLFGEVALYILEKAGKKEFFKSLAVV